MNCSPAMFTVVAKTVDAATEVWSIASIAVHSLTLIAHLTVQNIRLHLNLQSRGYTKTHYVKEISRATVLIHMNATTHPYCVASACVIKLTHFKKVWSNEQFTHEQTYW